MSDDTTPTGAPDRAPDTDAPVDDVEGHPRGTLVLSALFLMLMAATWMFVYFTMIARS